MPGAIDLMIVVDADTILASHAQPSLDPDAPTVLADDDCYLIAPPINTQGGRATAHLLLDTQGARFFHWRAQSLSGNADSGAVIYRLGEVARFRPVEPSTAHERQQWIPVPILLNGANLDPPDFSTSLQTAYFLRTLASGTGKRQFQACFYITVPDENGEPVLAGYFEWSADLTLG
jgi:hypothetical protein